MEAYKINKPWYRKWWGIILVVVAVFILALVLSLLFAFYQRVREFRQQPVVGSLSLAEMIPDYSPYLGSAAAPVQIVEFADWQCSYCAQGATTMLQLVDRYGSLVKFVFRQFPIAALHSQAWSAAVASTCVQEQGKFWEYYDLLFSNHDDLSEERLFSLAQGLGLDMEQWQACYDDEVYAWRIRKDLSDGVDLGIEGTPTYFLNGQMISGTLTLEHWEQLIESVL
jgi:protein-disulfide isomerase